MFAAAEGRTALAALHASCEPSATSVRVLSCPSNKSSAPFFVCVVAMYCLTPILRRSMADHKRARAGRKAQSFQVSTGFHVSVADPRARKLEITKCDRKFMGRSPDAALCLHRARRGDVVGSSPQRPSLKVNIEIMRAFVRLRRQVRLSVRSHLSGDSQLNGPIWDFAKAHRILSLSSRRPGAAALNRALRKISGTSP